MKVLLCDCGSTKADWALIDTDNPHIDNRFTTVGMNPVVDNEETLGEKFSQLVDVAKTQPDMVEFYGAGCINEDVCRQFAQRLKQALACDNVMVASDMLGAAKALCGDKPGIACILGTGSNTCLYDGEKIVDNVPSLGFILGDEGSGASMGKALVSGIIKRCFSKELTFCFYDCFDLSVPQVIERVYRGASPNAWLASFVPFIAKHLNRFDELNELVENQFELFVTRNIARYDDFKTLDSNFVGSLAMVFKPQLERVCALHDVAIGRIVAKPLDGMVAQFR